MISIDLSGSSAIVTGASQGLGSAIASTLYQAGASVVINYWPDPEGINRTKAEQLSTSLGERAMALAGDVRRLEDMAELVAATRKRFGRLDIVVNNAGILRDRSLKKMSGEEWGAVIDTNLTGVFNLCKAAEPALESGGSIISLSSISAAIGFYGQANYAAAKAGVVGLTKVLARELAKRRITVNAIAPGLVLTDMGKSIPAEERERMLSLIPLGRLGEANDIAGAALFLASNLSRYVTGQTLHVNGGWHLA